MHAAHRVRHLGGGQLLALVLEGESVAGLGLERGGAVPQERVEAARGEGGELLLRRRPGRAHRAVDAAAGRLDLQVGGAGQAGAVLGRPVARPREVRVGVDEAGDDGGALDVHDDGVAGHLEGARDLRLRAGPDDPAVASGDRTVRDHPGRAHRHDLARATHQHVAADRHRAAPSWRTLRPIRTIRSCRMVPRRRPLRPPARSPRTARQRRPPPPPRAPARGSGRAPASARTRGSRPARRRYRGRAPAAPAGRSPAPRTRPRCRAPSARCRARPAP